MERDIIDVRSSVMPIKCDLSYLAGLIDGEGSVGLYANGNGYGFIIQINMTDKDTINWLHETFGGLKYFVQRKKPHYKDAWRWVLCGNKAIELYQKIYSFLRIKRVYDLEPTINSGRTE